MTTPVVAIFVAKPGLEAELEATLRSVIATTLKEEGCISYQLNRDLDEPRRYVWTEEWVNRDLLKKHLAAPHIVELGKKLPALIESGDVIALGKVDGGKA